jgi:ribosomal protein L29
MAKKKNIRDLTLDELSKKLTELKDSMLNYRFQKTLQQLEDPKKKLIRIRKILLELKHL